MNNKVKDRHKKPNILLFQWYYGYKSVDPNNNKIDEKSYI